MTENSLICITGGVEDVVYYSEESGYVVLDMNVNGELVTAVGNMGDVREGEQLTLYGEYVMKPKYGRQFQVEIFERSLPTDVDDLRKYLGSGVIRGIGPSMAKKIVEAFGDKTLEILENDPRQLCSLKGISAERAIEIGQEFHNITGLRKAMTFFSKYGTAHAYVASAWKFYGGELIRSVSENPYLLCESGIELPFPDVERIARDLSFPMDSVYRLAAGILWQLRLAANEGNTCVREKALCNEVTEALFIDENQYNSALDFLKERQEIIDCGGFGERVIYLSEYYHAECYIADKLAEMIKRSNGEEADFSEEIEGIAWTRGIEYEVRQKQAINACMNNRVFILTGGPGTGKTTALNAVIELCRQRKLKIKLAAPTGRAAKRLSELTEAPAQTIHRLLEVDFASGEHCFKRNEENPLSCDVLIIDEMSMVDAQLFASLLKAVKSSTRLIMVGDSNQLPSVGAGNILHDLIDSKRVPTIELVEIFRQAAQSLIVTNAHRIIKGDYPELNDRKNDFFFMPSKSEADTLRLVVDLCGKRLPKSYGYDPFDDIQVLCLSKMGMLGTVNLNKELQLALNPPSKNKRELNYMNALFRDGDKIMQTKNDYDVEWRRGTEKSHGVFNGDIGRIFDADKVNVRCTIDFEGRKAFYDGEMLKKIDHAYAVTIHKSQGSEYPAVIIPLPNGMDRLSYRNLLYTAVTRAKSTLIIIGTENKIHAMIENNRRTERCSCLKQMLEDYFD